MNAAAISREQVLFPITKDGLVLQADSAWSQHAQSNASSHTSQPCCLFLTLDPLRSSAGATHHRDYLPSILNVTLHCFIKV